MRTRMILKLLKAKWPGTIPGYYFAIRLAVKYLGSDLTSNETVSITYHHTLKREDPKWGFNAVPVYAFRWVRYNGVILGVVAYQITSVSIVYSTDYSDADQRKQQSSTSLAFVRGIPRTKDK